MWGRERMHIKWPHVGVSTASCSHSSKGNNNHKNELEYPYSIVGGLALWSTPTRLSDSPYMDMRNHNVIRGLVMHLLAYMAYEQSRESLSSSCSSNFSCQWQKRYAFFHIVWICPKVNTESERLGKQNRGGEYIKIEYSAHSHVHLRLPQAISMLTGYVRVAWNC